MSKQEPALHGIMRRAFSEGYKLAERHPFDVAEPNVYQRALKLLRFGLRTKELKGLPKGTPRLHLPQPEAVRPVVTS